MAFATYPKENAQYTYNTAGIHSETEDECMLEGGGILQTTIQPGDVIRTLENLSNFKLNQSASGLPKRKGLVS